MKSDKVNLGEFTDKKILYIIKVKVKVKVIDEIRLQVFYLRGKRIQLMMLKDDEVCLLIIILICFCFFNEIVI